MPVSDTPTHRRPTPCPQVLIAVPGTGSDAEFVGRAFGPACSDLGIDLIALEPSADLIADHRRHVAEVAGRYERVLVGGISVGAALAVEWALQPSSHCCGVWAALPAWSGLPGSSLAATGAASTAAALRADGLEATIRAMQESSPAWLADELSRSWRALYPGLVDQLDQVARYRAPEIDSIATLQAPLALVAAHDDPLHPLATAEQWLAAAPRASLLQVGLDEWGAQPERLGHACARAWAPLHHHTPTPA